MSGVHHIAINGELGSGKSSVARRLADSYSIRLVSTGDVQRAIASELRLSTLETNLLAETDKLIDSRVDQVSRDLASSSEPILFDSRMAWHMVPGSFKIHLLVDSTIAAHRLHRRVSTVEAYQSPEDARALAEQRYLSERRRFIATYGVDIFRLKNYDLVVDTSAATVDEVVDTIRATLDAERGTAPAPAVFVSPRRILPGVSTWPIPADPDEAGPVEVGYARPFFFSLVGLAEISRAVRAGDALLPVNLRAEDDEPIAGVVSAEDYVRKAIKPSWIARWEDAHDFQFSTLPA
jgi:CMP/dCMP kinase